VNSAVADIMSSGDYIFIIYDMVQAKLLLKYLESVAESGGIRIVEIQKAIVKWCKLRSNVHNISNTGLTLSTLRLE